MALPSQTARPIARRNHMYRRSRKRRRPWLTVVILIAIVAAVYAGWRYWPLLAGGEAATGQGAEGDLVAAANREELGATPAQPVYTHQTDLPREIERQPSESPASANRRGSEPISGRDSNPGTAGGGGVEMGGSTFLRPPASSHANRDSAPDPAPGMARPCCCVGYLD